MSLEIGGGITIGGNVTVTPEWRTAVIVGHNTSPYVTAYKWDSTFGFGPKYADPGTLPTGFTTNIGVSPSEDAVAVVGSNSPTNIIAYQWSTTTGWGTKYTNPTGDYPSTYGESPVFSGTGGALAVGKTSGSLQIVYHWTYASGFGSLYTGGPNLTWAPLQIAFTSSSNVIVLSQNSNSPEAYRWSDASGWGTKYTNASGYYNNLGGLAFTANDAALIAAGTGSPYLFAFQWTYASGFGTKYANPATLPSGAVQAMTLSPNKDVVICVTDGSPFIDAYPWNNATGFGTRYSNPTTAISASAGSPPTDVAFSPDGAAVVVTTTLSSPYIAAYRWDNATGFGQKYNNPASVLPGGAQALAFTGI